MSTLNAGISEAYYSLKKWLGVNETADGGTNLRSGEAARMRNWRITDEGALKKRPGSAAVAGLLNGYTISTADEETAVFTEMNVSEKSVTAFHAANANSVGAVTFSGNEVELNGENSAQYSGYFYAGSGLDAWKHLRVEESADADTAGAEKIDGGYMKLTGAVYSVSGLSASWDTGTGIRIRGGDFELTGEPSIQDPANYFRRYNEYSGTWKTYKIIGETDEGRILYQEVAFVANQVYTWYANAVTAVNNGADTVVRGLWSGYVDGSEVIAAACSGHLWSLSESGGSWSKTDIGAIDTTGTVCLFGFGGKLYCLDGSDYYSWDGTSFGRVDGYVPCLAVASVPTGGGQSLEQVNKLTAKRRQRFSSDGTAKTYVLLEQNISAVDKVTVNGAEVTDYTKDLSAGSVTFSTAPEKGTDNVEIWWTSAENYREQVCAMRYAEFYNGVNDSRVFLYGDGSNQTLYSGLTEEGTPTAEYFPDLNVIHVGDENTPLTALVRMYSRLMAYKEGSAWSIWYDAITLADGSVTAGFYCNPVNRNLGCDAMGQACLVENRPRTVDGRSIYEWKSSSSGNITNDQRNAQRVSQNVESTLAGFDLSKSVMFFDKIAHEFYCVYGGTAVVQNTENSAWYVYTSFPAVCLIVYKDELYYGTESGELRRFSEDYTSDAGEAIDAYWESGSMSFDRDYVLKYSPSVWVGMKQEPGAAVTVGIRTDTGETSQEDVQLSGEGSMPAVKRLRLKAQRFVYYKLLFSSLSAESRATVVAADIRVKYNIRVK